MMVKLMRGLEQIGRNVVVVGGVGGVVDVGVGVGVGGGGGVKRGMFGNCHGYC